MSSTASERFYFLGSAGRAFSDGTVVRSEDESPLRITCGTGLGKTELEAGNASRCT
jgi:hypothetical protein